MYTSLLFHRCMYFVLFAHAKRPSRLVDRGSKPQRTSPAGADVPSLLSCYPGTIAIGSAQKWAPLTPTPLSSRTLSPAQGGALDEKILPTVNEKAQAADPDLEIKAVAPASDGEEDDKDVASEDAIIDHRRRCCAASSAAPDDGDPALTFRSIFLATILSAFQAVMFQIY